MHNSKDDHITRSVNNKLASRGFGSQSKLTVQTGNELVTVSGSVQYPHQKIAAIKAISGMGGIRRVVDQITVKPAGKRT